MYTSSDDIRSFWGEFRFLSNFFPDPVEMDGVIYPTVEHAYQAAKTRDRKERSQIQKAETPGHAKKMGGRVKLRKDWESSKIGIMESLVLQKFQSYSDLGDQLLATGDRTIVEENDWNDTFWGVCDGQGSNHLGKILMRVQERVCESRQENKSISDRGEGG